MKTFYPVLRLCSFIIFLNTLALTSTGQTDTKFWFAVPEFSYNGSPDFDRPIYLSVSTFSQAATVTISQPAGIGGSYMPTQILTLAANSTQKIDLTPYIDSLETKPADQVVNFGLYVSSTAPITVSYIQASVDNPEIFTLKGRNALGVDFWVPGQNVADNSGSYNPAAKNSFDIIASQNNTTVTINPIKDIIGHTAGTPYSIVLNAGQTYSAVAVSQAAANHLVGSRVTSDKPIAITVKEDEITSSLWAGGCQDAMGEQVVPTNILGTDYIGIKSPLQGQGDYLCITATQNNTTVTLNGGAVVATLNAGQTYSTTMPTSSVYLHTSLPVTVWQIAGIGCEVGGTNLPQIQCSGSTAVSYTRSSNEFLYFNLLVENGGQGSFLLNGTPGIITAGQFAAVPGTGGQWYTAQINMPLGTYPINNIPISVTNPTSKFHMSVQEGGTVDGSTYGYYSDFNSIPAFAYADQAKHKMDTICLGSDIHLVADSTVGGIYSWTGPNGFTSSQQSPVITNADLTASGKYVLNVVLNGCSNTDTAYIQVVAMPAPPIVRNDTLCTGTQTTVPIVTGITGNTINWYSIPTGGTGSTTAPVIQTSFAHIDTFYVSQTSVYGCESGRVPVEAVIIQGFNLTPMNDTAICGGSSAQLSTSGAVDYLWIPATGLSCTTCANPISTPSKTTTYTVIGYDGIVCFDTTSVTVAVDSPIASFTINKHNFCQEDSMVVTNTSQGINSAYTWRWGDSAISHAIDTSHKYALPGTYHITLIMVDNGMCSDTAKDTVVVDTAGSFIRFTTDSVACVYKAITFTPEYSAGATDIVWTLGDQADSLYSRGSIAHAYDHSGTITVTITGRYGTCPALSYSNTITIFPYPLVNIGPDTSLCPGQPSILLTNLNATPDSYTNNWSTGATTGDINVNTPDTYWLTVTSGHGCSTADTIEVRNNCFLHIPNVFTPNGDDLNDYFFPKEVLASGVTAFHMQIFDRWGMQIFETTKTTGRGWDGKFNDKSQPEGVYVYLIDVSYLNGTSEKYKGNVTLLR